VLGHMLKPIERQSFFAVIWGGDFKTITCGQAIDAPAHSRILVDSRRS
jgi:hypothetical protein